MSAPPQETGRMETEMDVDASEPRGTKRTAEDASLPEPPRRIRPLSEDVVNKIAAGEIIVAPVHALKELIENAVDAGSTALEILVRDGGLKLLQITDNGHGIDREDLPILCERFTTSKLRAFEDLSSMSTYGFRGEALASISHIAHLSVTTRTKESSCAWRTHYSGGKLAAPKPGQSAEPKPCAGRQGTQITVEDLFYNVPTRRRAFRSASEEYAKILDLVGRYAVHCSGVSFTCKKHGESSMGLSVPAAASTVDRIRQVHGSGVANELIQFEAAEAKWGFKSEGWISNANYSVKRTALLLFINHRAVESSAIKKAIEQTYAAFLPKGGKPFVYLSLEIDPQRVDVNVHPTKREVNFLNEDEIIETICEEIRASLGKVDVSRTYMTQTLLPGAKVPTIAIPTIDPATGTATSGSAGTPKPAQRGSQRPYENNLVRVDSKARKITSMLPPSAHLSSDAAGLTSDPAAPGAADPDRIEYTLNDREPTICRLTSVKELRAEVREEMHNGLTDVIAGHTFVGLVDMRRRIAAVQGGVKLYLVDYGLLCRDFFYQLGLTDFGNFGAIRFDPPLDLDELLRIGAEQERAAMTANDNDDLDWEDVIQTVRTQLLSMRAMLAEYFALDLSDTGALSSIPLLLRGYVPAVAKLPRFLLRLGPRVDWTDERACFRSFLRELAAFYVPEPLPDLPSDRTGGGEKEERGDGDGGMEEVGEREEEEPEELAARRRHLARAIEFAIFPAMKARMVATKGMLRGVTEVANLKGLYRVFERC